MSKALSIFESGDVGSVTALCIAAKGYSVTNVDLGTRKVKPTNPGRTFGSAEMVK